MKAEQRDPVLREKRISRTDVGQLGRPFADQVGDAHRIEDARVRRLRRGQVGIAVEVHQPEVGLPAEQAGDHAQCDRAVAPDDERHDVTLDRSSDGIGNLAGNLGHARGALSFAIGAVGLKASNREIAQVFQLEAGRSERADQARLAQYGRRLFLAGTVGARARRYPDETDPKRHRSTLPRPEPGCASHREPSAGGPPGWSRPTSPSARQSGR